MNRRPDFHVLGCCLLDTAPERGGSRVATMARMVQVAWITAVHALRWAGRRLRRSVTSRHESAASVLGRSLTELLEDLGATFVKVGQVLSSRPDLLPPDVITHLRRLQQDVTPFPRRDLQRALGIGLGAMRANVFSTVDLELIASASVANVYRAPRPDGGTLAVKVRRPGLWRQVDMDLRIMNGLARLAQHLPPCRVVPVTGVVDEISGAIRRQVDLRTEAANNRRFRQNFSNNAGVVIPALVDELCSRSVLTMDFVTDLTTIDRLATGTAETQHFALRGLRALYQMIFVDGFVHVDMHPGNVFSGSAGEFVILDWGLVAELTDEDRVEFARFFIAMATNDGQACADIVLKTAQAVTSAFDTTRFSAAMVSLISRYAGLPARDFEVARFAMDLFDTQRRHGVRGSTNFTLVIVSLVVFEGIVKQIAPDLDFQAEAVAFLGVAGASGQRQDAT